ncbi:MAG TPA: methylmalonyl-CoA mutase family protein, partial [Terriglobales bacterium]|nr:methylmalonyl-CoA mutase family protein [Terriglobales bacterium]
GSAEETNARYHFLLKSGQTGLSVAFDLPTQIGYDSDHPLAQGEVGKVGVAIDSLWDMERLFQGIPLDQVSTSMTINSPCAVIMAMYLAVAEKQGVPFDKLRGTVQNDILKEYPARGTYIFAPRPSMRLITDIFAYCTKEVPQWNTISISGYHIREAGSTAVQEVAFTLANGIAYVEAAILLALYVAVAKRAGADVKKLSGTVQNDILKEYIARGTYIYPPQHAMRIVTDIFAYANREVPEWNTISISGYHMREAGSTAVQEVAFTLGNGIAYVQAALDAGLDVDRFAPRIAFFFNAHSNFLEEVAKYRAARRLWAKIMRERFHAKNPRSWMLRFHTQTAGSTLTAQQPENNIVRTALQALAAVLGGTQSLHTNSYDEALALPTEDAVRVALRTQQILAYESGVAQTIDPLAGSYCVESLTNEIEARAQAYLERIEALGGMLRAIERGFVQQEIQNAAYEYQQAVDRLEAVVVGVNRFTAESEKAVPLQKIDENVERKQVERVRALRVRRDAARWKAALEQVEEAARSGENLLPRIIAAVEACATVGEISDALRRVFGEYHESVFI